MRWRTGGGGPQNEQEINLIEPVSPNVDEDDEQDFSLSSSAQQEQNNRSHQHGEESSTSTSSEIGEEEEEDSDDPGLDHAEPLNWKPQSQQSTCEFTHVISNYSQKRESGCKKAEYSNTTIDDYGNRWRLIVYVNGNGRASNHHLSLFLQVADADDLPFGWKKAVSYVLTLEHPSGNNMGYAKRNPDKTFKLCPKAIDWGWSQFITSDRIQQEGYVADDSLTVRASVTVKSSSISIDPEDAELYLKCAVEEGNPEAVQTCLAQGAGVNCQFKDDLYTPLHTACSSTATTGSLQVLELLLDKGADGNACNKWRETPLLIAANNGHLTAVEALLKHGADPSLCSEAGWSALTFAAHKGYDDIVELLLKAGAPVNCRVTEDLSTPLHKACAGGKPGHLSAVKQLLENGADVHALNKWRETPLLTAANHGQASAVEALLRSGADPCKCTDTGWSPLSIAAYKGHDDVVRLLLEAGAPTEEADPTLSALLQAATKGLPDTVELLLRHGADHTVTTKKGDTALSILVEQNFIDAAVEMVTEYKANVHRCSRDRKKAQRARLLINLRVKQQQKEGLLSLTNDDETDQATDESNQALHEDGSSAAPTNSTGGKKKKKKKKTMASAEAEARAAAEALILELEQEESKAQKDEAAANSKRAKKKKKKERERQQREQKEREQREREEKEAEERERQRKVKEEKERKEREQRFQEQKEREMKEAEEHIREAAARRKEKEEKERKLREQERKEKERERLKKAAEVNESGQKYAEKPKPKKQSDLRPNGVHAAQKRLQQPSITPKAAGPISGRGWEKPPSLSPTKSQPTVPNLAPGIVGGPRLTKATSEVIRPLGRVRGYQSEDHMKQMAAGMVEFLDFDSDRLNPVQGPSSMQPSSNPFQMRNTSRISDSAQAMATKLELPEVVLFRQEKLGQLFQRCAEATSQVSSNPLGVVGEGVVKAVVYRWIIRAAHDSSPYLDCMIPSWTDFDLLTTFLQRQFIAESRKGLSTASTGAGMVSMEALKEAGTAFARLCHSLAKDLVQFREQRENQLPIDWSDLTLGLVGTEVMKNGRGSMICIDWAKRAQVYLSHSVFSRMTERHAGPSSRLLTALFTAKKRYEIMRVLTSRTTMDYRISRSTKESLSRDAKVNGELWSDPFSTMDNWDFFGCFEDVDTFFGGFAPFAKESVSSELSKIKRGISLAGMAPLDNMLASLYVRRILDLLDAGEKEGIPISAILILHAACFRDLNRSPNVNDAVVLEPRLAESHRSYVKCAELLPAGQHVFCKGDGEGSPEVCRTGSLFMLFQNEAGKVRFEMSKAALLSVIRSMKVDLMPAKETYGASTMSYQGSYMKKEPLFSKVSFSPQHAPTVPPVSLSPIGGPPLASSQSAPAPFANGSEPRWPVRRGRLFDLIDDGEDDNGDDVVSGMLNNLDASLFRNSQDVDIEAISLMGISGLGDGPLAPSGYRSVSGPAAPGGSSGTHAGPGSFR